MRKIIVIALLILLGCGEKQSKKAIVIHSKTALKDTIIAPTYNFDKNFVLGKFDYKADSSFVKVAEKYATKVIFLQKETYDAFQKMHQKAKQEGIDLVIISGTRSFAEQKRIWERKWKKHKHLTPIERAKKILTYSSMPSSSRHHWGTDIDLNNLNNSYFEGEKGKKEYDWLVNNANNFGFYQVYTAKKNGRTGYNEEKWHWSYLPLAKNYLAFYNSKITARDIQGFQGAELAGELHIIKDFVNGVSRKILKVQ